MTRKLGILGDVSPIEHGGGYVLVANDGDPYLEYFEGLESIREDEIDLDNPDHLKLKATIYHCDIPKCDSDFVAEFDWIDWGNVESCIGGDLAIGNTQQRAAAIVDIASYYGWFEVDQYPLELTLGELIKRWKDY